MVENKVNHGDEVAVGCVLVVVKHRFGHVSDTEPKVAVTKSHETIMRKLKYESIMSNGVCLRTCLYVTVSCETSFIHRVFLCWQAVLLQTARENDRS